VVAPMLPLPSEAHLMEIFYNTNGFKSKKSNRIKRLERDIKSFIKERLSLDVDVSLVHSFREVFVWVRAGAIGDRAVYYSHKDLANPDVFVMTIAKDFIFS
jgi:hypothetical protein